MGTGVYACDLQPRKLTKSSKPAPSVSDTLCLNTLPPLPKETPKNEENGKKPEHLYKAHNSWGLQWLLSCLNQASQEQIARQTVICQPLLSSDGFPPVQTDKQAAYSYGQVGPVVPDTGSLELVRHRRAT